MRRSILLASFLILTLVVGCRGSTAPATVMPSLIMEITPSLLPPLLGTSSTSTKTTVPTATEENPKRKYPTITPLEFSPVLSPTPGAEFEKVNCLNYVDKLPQNGEDQGGIVLSKNKGISAVIASVPSGNVELTLVEHNFTWTPYVVSPDRKWLAYQVSTQPNGKRNLIIATADGSQYKTIDSGEGWNFIWLDSKRLLTSPMNWDRKEWQQLTLLNPFTNEREKLAPELPDSFFLDYFHWNFYTSSGTVYAPDLKHMIFPAIENKKGWIILWDVENNKEIGKFSFYNIKHPAWSPDGKEIAFIVGNTSIDTRGYKEDLFMITQEGESVRLTNLSEFHASNFLSDFSWSPDGRYIAFLSSYNPDDVLSNLQLEVLDTKSGVIINYCAPNASTKIRFLEDSAPVWSPDGLQLVVGAGILDQAGKERSQSILINLAENYAGLFADDAYPQGWLARLP